MIKKTGIKQIREMVILLGKFNVKPPKIHVDIFENSHPKMTIQFL